MPNNEFENVEVHEIDTARPTNGNSNVVADVVATGKTIEQIRSKYHTAIRVQVPRDLDVIKDKCLKESKHGGDTFGWAWPVTVNEKFKDENGRDAWRKVEKIVEGRSVHLAMAAARNWTNCTTEVFVTGDFTDRYELLGVFVDFETGYTNMRPYTIRKDSRDLSEKQKQKASQVARQMDMTMQIGLSKCIRNVILSSIPAWLTDEMFEESKKYAKSRIETNLAESIEKAIFVFKKYGVNESRLEVFIEAPKEKWTADDVLKLRGAVQAIKDGETIDSIFPNVTATEGGGSLANTVDPAAPATQKHETISGGFTGDLTPDQLKDVQFIQQGIDALAKWHAEKGTDFSGIAWLKKITEDVVHSAKDFTTVPEQIDKVARAMGGMLAERGIILK